MFDRQLKQAVLHYFGEKASAETERLIDKSLAIAAQRRQEFEERRKEIIKEIKNRRFN